MRTVNDQRRDEFQNILYDLAKSQDYLKDRNNKADTFRRFEKLYGNSEEDNGFHHFYSDIFLVLFTIKKEPNRGDVNILNQNINIICKRPQSIHCGSKPRRSDTLCSCTITQMRHTLLVAIAQM